MSVQDCPLKAEEGRLLLSSFVLDERGCLSDR